MGPTQTNRCDWLSKNFCNLEYLASFSSMFTCSKKFTSFTSVFKCSKHISGHFLLKNFRKLLAEHHVLQNFGDDGPVSYFFDRTRMSSSETSTWIDCSIPWFWGKKSSFKFFCRFLTHKIRRGWHQKSSQLRRSQDGRWNLHFILIASFKIFMWQLEQHVAAKFC